MKSELDPLVESLEQGIWTPKQAHSESARLSARLAEELEPAPRPRREQPWPTSSLEAERRFGQPHAKLFPYIRKRVWTPTGPGTLLSAFAEQCEILPEGATKTVRAEDVRPIQ
jgi:hypothetical protein